MLIGFAVGGGSTLFEEFAYGGDATALTRLFLVTFHGLLGVIMAGSVGMAKYKKVNGKGSGIPEYVISFVLPVVLHLVFSSWGEHYYFDMPMNELLDKPGSFGGYFLFEDE